MNIDKRVKIKDGVVWVSTDDPIFKSIAVVSAGKAPIDMVERYIKRAIHDTVENCARIAESLSGEYNTRDGDMEFPTPKEIADIIRKKLK